MSKRNDLGVAGAVAGIGLALGAAALGAFLSKRHDRDADDDDAPPSAWRKSPGDDALAGRTLTIRKPRAELFAFWRDFSNFPRVMENVEKVTEESGADGRATWTIKAPGGASVEVKTEIAEERANEFIAWRSVEGSDIETSGRVEFAEAPGDRGTRVTLVISYDPPAGAAGRAIAKLFQREPQIQARHDLKRFKMLMETGEIATSARTREETRAAKQENAR